MARAAISAIILVCAGFSLAGCVEGKGPLAAKPKPEAGAEVARSATSVRLVDRDVEAPQVFQVSDQALWDGRPSLGGVWVASPDAVDPERVILRNEANGKFVIGALFRRERLNPGPALQISSDAAAALGILAGQPTSLNVTALRREEAPAEPATETTKPILDAAETVETETLTASAGAAIARAEPAAATPAPVAEAAAPLATEEPALETAAAETAPAAPEKKKWRLFGKKKSKAPEASALDATAAVASDTVETTAAIATDTVEATVLPAASGAVAAAPIAAAAKPSTVAPRSTSLIQIGIFSVEANAGRAKAMLEKSGVSARVLTEQSQGKTFWRVVADPAADRNATLQTVKSAGFGDAYFVTR